MTRTCAKRVFSGARNDMSGHRCGHRAMKGSEFCHLHGGKTAEDPTAEATGAPSLSSSQRTTYFARLEWEPGEGPVVALPYISGHGFITKAFAKATDDGPASIEVRGLKRKANGEPGQQHWDSTYGAEKLLGEAWTRELLAQLELEREGR